MKRLKVKMKKTLTGQVIDQMRAALMMILIMIKKIFGRSFWKSITIFFSFNFFSNFTKTHLHQSDSKKEDKPDKPIRKPRREREQKLDSDQESSAAVKTVS